MEHYPDVVLCEKQQKREQRLKAVRDQKDKLAASDFHYETSIASGMEQPGSNIACSILKQEIGKPFSVLTKRKLRNHFLVNTYRTLMSHKAKVYCGIFSPDGKYFITAGQDRKIEVFDASEDSYRKVNTILGNDVGWSIIDVAVSPDGNHLAYSSWSNLLHQCPIEGPSEAQQSLLLQRNEHRFCIFSLAFSPDGRDIVAGAKHGFVYIYDRVENRRTCKFPAHYYDVNSVAFSDQSTELIFTGGDDGLVKLWDRRCYGNQTNPQPVAIHSGHLHGITHVDARGDGRHFISNSKDQTIKLWDIRVPSRYDDVDSSLQYVKRQTWDYRWQTVPYTYTKLNKLDGDTSLMTYRSHSVSQTLIRARFSPLFTTGQRFIYTGCSRGNLIIYCALTGDVVKWTPMHNDCVRDVSWHPYRNEIMTSSWDSFVKMSYYQGQKCGLNS